MNPNPNTDSYFGGIGGVIMKKDNKVANQIIINLGIRFLGSLGNSNYVAFNFTPPLLFWILI
jgi:hypothetical protein